MLIVDQRGGIRCLYAEQIDLTCLGSPSIARASHVEPDGEGHWWADLAPMRGPCLGPFPRRSEALDTEQQWLESWLTGACKQLRS